MENNSFTLKNGAVFRLDKESIDCPAQVVIIYNNDLEALNGFEDMKKSFKRLHLLK